MTLAALGARITARLPKGRVARGIITLASGTALAQLITICAMPIVTRLYTPAQIGVISLFLAFFAFWAATLSLRYEYALLIAKDDAESHIVHRLAVIIVVVMSLLGLPILWALQRSAVLGFGLLPVWAPLAAVPILFGQGIFMVYRSWALRAGMVGSITKAAIARSGANSTGQVTFGLMALGVPGLFAAQGAKTWVAMLKLANGVNTHFAYDKPERIPWVDLRRIARKFVKFPAFETPSTWVDQVGLTLPLPMIAALHGAAAAGWFGLARMIVAVPNAQIGGAVADVFQMELANAVVAEDTTRARGLFYKLLRKLALLGLLPLGGVVACAPWLVPWIFGERWHEAGIAAAAIAPWLYAGFVIGPLSRALSVLQVQQYKLVYDVCAVALLIAAFVLSKLGNWKFVGTVLAISAAGFLGYVVYAVVLIVIIERQIGRKTSE